MLVQEALALVRNNLKHVFTPDELSHVVRVLCNDILQIPYTKAITEPATNISALQKSELQQAIEQLQQHRPLQYVIGNTEFFGLQFTVNESVLIPRPETEELTEWIVQDYKNTPPYIMDVCTGSGCIAVSLAHHIPDSRVWALDISDEALAVALKNATDNGVQVTLLQTDILTTTDHANWHNMFDIVVSNPPYVRYSEQEQMQANVMQYEPHLALFVPDENPLIFYDAIARFARQTLKTGGCLYFEINEAFGQQTSLLLQQQGFTNIIVRNDLSRKPRMIKAQKNS